MSAPVVIPAGPFGDGYEDGLFGRSSRLNWYETARARVKYSEGYQLGEQDRRAGTLEPDVDAS